MPRIYSFIFCFIHKGRCFDLFQWPFGSLGGVDGSLGGVGRPLSVPTCFRFRHVNQAGLRLFWAGVEGWRKAVTAGVRL